MIKLWNPTPHLNNYPSNCVIKLHIKLQAHKFVSHRFHIIAKKNKLQGKTQKNLGLKLALEISL
jgi:hypothetical protein